MTVLSRQFLPSFTLLLLAAVVRAEPPARTDAQGDPLPAGALARLGTTRFRDGNNLNQVALAPDGKTITVSGPQSLRILDLATGKELRTLKTNGAANYMSATYSPDGKILAAVEYTGRIVFWNPATGDTVGEVAPPAAPAGGIARNPGNLSFSGDGKYVAIGDNTFGNAKNHATVYEVATGKQTAQVEVLHNQNVRAFLSGDGKVLVTTGQYFNRGGVAEPPQKQQENNQTLELWEATTGKELRKIRNENGWGINNVAFTPDGKQMVVAGQTGSLTIWDVASGKEVRRVAGRRNIGTFLAYSPDGKTLAAGSMDGVVQTWDLASGKRLGLYDVPRHNQVGRLQYTTDGRLLSCGSNGPSVQVWDVLAEKSLTPVGGHQTAISALAFTANGKALVSASNDGTLLFWDAAGKQTKQLQLRDENVPFRTGPLYLNGLRLSPDGKLVLASTPNGMALYELNKGREVCTLFTGFSGFGPIGTFSADGARLALGSTDPQARKPVVRLFDVGTGQELRVLDGHAGDARATAFAPDGKMVAAASTNVQAAQTSEVRVWDAGTGKTLWRAERPQVWVQGLTFSPNSKVLAALESTGAITLYETADGREQRQLAGGGGNATVLTFSPNGRLLAVALHDFNERKTHLRVYEVSTGTVRQEFTGHDGQVSALAFAPDGKRLASGGNDTTLLLWDLTGNISDDLPKGKPTADELDKFWEALNDADSRAAFKTMRRLEAAPAEAVTLLTKHVKAAEGKGADADAIAKLIAALDADDFEERQKAGKDLAALGKTAEEPLKKALTGKPSAEAKRAIEDLLEKMKDKGGPPPELVRPLRAVEVLENLGTPEARKLLETLAKGQAGAPLTVAAKEALARLEDAAKP
jgi:WD40 repeat protein